MNLSFLFDIFHFSGTTLSLAVLAVGFQLAAYNTPPIDISHIHEAASNTSCLSYK